MEPSDSPLAALIARLRAYFECHPKAVRLRSSASLTFCLPGKGYVKLTRLANERFFPADAYVGKRGALIFTFRPEHANGTDERMEMDNTRAIADLDGFGQLLNDGVNGVFAVVLRAAIDAGPMPGVPGKRVDASVDTIGNYADGGSW